MSLSTSHSSYASSFEKKRNQPCSVSGTISWIWIGNTAVDCWSFCSDSFMSRVVVETRFTDAISPTIGLGPLAMEQSRRWPGKIHQTRPWCLRDRSFLFSNFNSFPEQLCRSNSFWKSAASFYSFLCPLVELKPWYIYPCLLDWVIQIAPPFKHWSLSLSTLPFRSLWHNYIV